MLIFDPVPIAAASLGQVHAAALREGRAVVVKVQRPDIRKQIAEDFEVLAQIAGFLDAHTDVGRRYRFASVLEEFRQTIHHEPAPNSANRNGATSPDARMPSPGPA